MAKKNNLLLKVVSSVIYVFAIIFLFASGYILLKSYNTIFEAFTIGFNELNVAIIFTTLQFLVMGIFLALLAYGIWNAKKWARIAAVLVTFYLFLDSLQFLIQSIMLNDINLIANWFNSVILVASGLVTIYLLLSKNAQRMFR